MSENPEKMGWWRRYRARQNLPTLDDIPKDRPYFSGRLPFIILLVLICVGIFATGFLTYRHVVMVSQTGTMGGSALCRADGNINCDAILLTDEATLFGYIPSAALGLMGCVFAFWLVANGLLNERLRKLSWTILILYFFTALGFSWYFVYLMIFAVPFICPWCIVVHVVNALCVIVITVVAVIKRKDFLYPEIASLGERICFVTAGVAISLMVLFASGMIEKELSFQEAKSKYENIINDPVVIMAILKAAKTHEIPITPADPIIGSPDAPYSLVFFGDFECPVCTKTERFLEKVVQANPGTLNMVYKNYPLSTKCNSFILEDLHPNSCKASVAAYAAFMTGGNSAYWAYVDLLAEHRKSLKKDPYIELARKIGLSTERFSALIKPGSPVYKKVQEDINLGTELGLSSTPQIFFLGKRIPETLRGQFLIHTMEDLIHVMHPEKKDVQLRIPRLLDSVPEANRLQ